MRKFISAILVLFFSAIVYAAPHVMVHIRDFAYSPARITVPVGTTVTWVNDGRVTHSVYSSDESNTLDSGDIDPDQGFTYTFSHPGKYPYSCEFHPWEIGTVIVR